MQHKGGDEMTKDCEDEISVTRMIAPAAPLKMMGSLALVQAACTEILTGLPLTWSYPPKRGKRVPLRQPPPAPLLKNAWEPVDTVVPPTRICDFHESVPEPVEL